MPRKTFVAGEVLLAQDVNQFLMDQSVMNFASSAARSSAIPTPTEGMFAVTTDNDQLDYYNGSAWVSALPVGAWTAYTPTFTGFTLGNGSLTFAYAQIGKTVHLRGNITLGSTSAVTGPWTVSLPVNAITIASRAQIGQVTFIIADFFNGVAFANTASAMTLQVLNASGTYTTMRDVSATIPGTWATGSNLAVVATYQGV